MKSIYRGIAYISLGVVLPIVLWLIADWFYVKVPAIRNGFPDFLFLTIWALLSTLLIYSGLTKLSNNKLLSAIATLFFVIVLFAVNVFFVLTFHSWIGGTF